ncbi:MAG: hypothetical protein IKO92_01750 [Clostridia bacterium]|nr:hypothetical protein [Clostridia bacterium]
MYQVGDAVLYGNNGVCRIREITRMESCGMVDDFYVLKPVSSEATTVFVPLTSEVLLSRMHPLLSPDEMKKQLDALGGSAPIWIENENQRKILFREIMNGGDRLAIFRVYLTLRRLREEREKKGKHLRVSDERSYRETERIFFDEISLVLGWSREEAAAYLDALPVPIPAAVE